MDLLIAYCPGNSQVVSQRWICFDNCTCCHTEKDVADQTCYLTQSPCPDTGPTSPSADPLMPGACQGNHKSTTHFLSHWYDPITESKVWSPGPLLSRVTPHHEATEGVMLTQPCEIPWMQHTTAMATNRNLVFSHISATAELRPGRLLHMSAPFLWKENSVKHTKKMCVAFMHKRSVKQQDFFSLYI